MSLTDADIDTPWRNLARSVIGKAISDYLLPPTSRERRLHRDDAEIFLFPKTQEYRAVLYSWLNLAGLDATFFTNVFCERLRANRDETLWSGTLF